MPGRVYISRPKNAKDGPGAGSSGHYGGPCYLPPFPIFKSTIVNLIIAFPIITVAGYRLCPPKPGRNMSGSGHGVTGPLARISHGLT